jgi:hypothetical protein
MHLTNFESVKFNQHRHFLRIFLDVVSANILQSLVFVVSFTLQNLRTAEHNRVQRSTAQHSIQSCGAQYSQSKVAVIIKWHFSFHQRNIRLCDQNIKKCFAMIFDVSIEITNMGTETSEQLYHLVVT